MLFADCTDCLEVLTKNVARRCRLSWLTNGALVYEAKFVFLSMVKIFQGQAFFSSGTA
jgi:hypothetical protein